MVKQGIKIFCRIKPTKSKTGLYEIEEDDAGYPKLSVLVPKDLAAGFINNKKEEYSFRFDGLFDQHTKQDEIFHDVAKDVIDNCLLGFNGTIFAYGQTGSGKTFTITGGPERYIDRGIIPRTLSYLFEEYAKSPGNVFTTHVSYLEIYNDSGYDLLDPKHEAAKLEDLPKVSLMEGSDGNIHLKNLSIHQANNEEEALNLLFLGDTNRMIAETPMNQASTRSHCIFTVHVSVREAGTATIRRAKLHLVDLAGSERIGKTGVGGTQLTEAKYINLSLHFLEQVIVALSEKSRSHIPYRNSMMTSVLRDSLGGNCMTTMIATCSMQKKSIDESISTCRFAQRVALIKNDAILNEEVDPKLMIARLKAEIQELKNQLALATGEQDTGQLSEESLERLNELVDAFLQDADPEATLNVGADMRKINACFRILKRLAQGKGFASNGSGSRPREEEKEEARQEEVRAGPPGGLDPAASVSLAEMGKMQELLKQRDNEINILVNMLKKEKKRAQDALSQLRNSGPRAPPQTDPLSASASSSTTSSFSSDRGLLNGGAGAGGRSGEGPRSHGRTSRHRHGQSDGDYGSRDGARHSADQSEDGGRSGKAAGHEEQAGHLSDGPSHTKRRILGDMSVGRQEAFEIFRRDYPHNATIEDNKLQLKDRYTQAKAKGQFVNECRQNINKLKSQIEHRRLQRAMSGEDQHPGSGAVDEVEQSLRHQLEQEKDGYKATFGRLRELKTEIEHLQHFLEKSRLQLQRDFELWWAEQAAGVQDEHPRLPQPLPPMEPPSSPSKAWRTPPVSPLTEAPVDDRRGPASPRRPSSRPAGRPHSGASRNALLGALPAPHGDARGGGGGGSGRGSEQDQELRSNAQRSRTPLDSTGRSAVQLTGDKRADADIMAFIKARQNLLQAKGQAPR